MSSRAAQLAMSLRRIQWDVDETAHALPEGRITDEDCRKLADALEGLAQALRDHATASVIIEQ